MIAEVIRKARVLPRLQESKEVDKFFCESE